ncbi:hypothetical protein ALP73_02399 [Pseudomonas coronafaciens pv. garcae]|uniref:Uncharacterized protein n=2 Tax=Pseudomonas syringae group TaxID=136849 RepID=A0AB37QLI7_9PSED|nr:MULTISPECIES: hypothetical protein [Pseudomonas syringae group]MCQ3014418.1 hypothetical protein [Pseudomonas tremae]QGL57023.1 hypothetical protein POR16_11990 [Pseudomonas coronafaciens pv. oryzae str. 1_6]RMM80061.1 hypothetical protein ALQ71_102002 [Pseudomonas coronafaciens pv. striafaciens]RMO00645.1 hypothetical protein ALQ50_101519 [Pseudomonas coronafaciens pv. coronafaciens]RMR97911.1 hypothetical protein ALP74_00429 [Pseudomonas coronafaciens pv. garcae]
MTDLYIQNQQSKVCEIHKMEYCTLCANDLKPLAGKGSGRFSVQRVVEQVAACEFAVGRATVGLITLLSTVF